MQSSSCFHLLPVILRLAESQTEYTVLIILHLGAFSMNRVAPKLHASAIGSNGGLAFPGANAMSCQPIVRSFSCWLVCRSQCQERGNLVFSSGLTV